MAGPRTPAERAFITALRRYKHLGFERIHELLIHEWMRDIAPCDEEPEGDGVVLMGKVIPLKRKRKVRREPRKV